MVFAELTKLLARAQADLSRAQTAAARTPELEAAAASGISASPTETPPPLSKIKRDFTVRSLTDHLRHSKESSLSWIDHLSNLKAQVVTRNTNTSVMSFKDLLSLKKEIKREAKLKVSSSSDD